MEVGVATKFCHDSKTNQCEEILRLTVWTNPIIIILVIINLLFKELPSAPSLFDIFELDGVSYLYFE
jgi:hypothetical protein